MNIFKGQMAGLVDTHSCPSTGVTQKLIPKEYHKGLTSVILKQVTMNACVRDVTVAIKWNVMDWMGNKPRNELKLAQYAKPWLTDSNSS